VLNQQKICFSTQILYNTLICSQ